MGRQSGTAPRSFTIQSIRITGAYKKRRAGSFFGLGSGRWGHPLKATLSRDNNNPWPSPQRPPNSFEIFQWLTDEQSREIVNDESEMALIRQEIADVMIYLVRLADKLDIDIEKAVMEKIDVNENVTGRFKTRQGGSV